MWVIDTRLEFDVRKVFPFLKKINKLGACRNHMGEKPFAGNPVGIKMRVSALFCGLSDFGFCCV